MKKQNVGEVKLTNKSESLSVKRLKALSVYGVTDEEVKIIKRYQNRKLYDTQQSCYVTLEDIAKMIRTNERILVFDNKSKRDITAATLTQIIFEAEKKASKFAPLFTLREIIQHGNGSISNYLAKLGAFSASLGPNSPSTSPTSTPSATLSSMTSASTSLDTTSRPGDMMMASTPPSPETTSMTSTGHFGSGGDSAPNLRNGLSGGGGVNAPNPLSGTTPSVVRAPGSLNGVIGVKDKSPAMGTNPRFTVVEDNNTPTLPTSAAPTHVTGGLGTGSSNEETSP